MGDSLKGKWMLAPLRRTIIFFFSLLFHYFFLCPKKVKQLNPMVVHLSHKNQTAGVDVNMSTRNKK